MRIHWRWMYAWLGFLLIWGIKDTYNGKSNIGWLIISFIMAILFIWQIETDKRKEMKK